MLHHFTVDVEEYFQVSAFEPWIPQERWHSLESRVADNVASLLELLSAHGVRGTFFVLGWVAERQPEIVRAIAQSGHEVASHGWDHRRVTELTQDEFRTSVRRSKRILENIADGLVVGYRAPSFSIVPGCEWALNILVEEGYRYDSSLFPVWRAGYGYPNGGRDPHTLNLPSGQLAEVPPVTIRLAKLNLPAAGGAYFRLFPYAYTKAAVKNCERRGRPATIYIHPWEIDPEQPRLDVPLLTRIRHYGGLRRTLARLERLLREFSFHPIADTVETLIARDPSSQPGSRIVRGSKTSERVTYKAANPSSSSGLATTSSQVDQLEILPYDGNVDEWDTFVAAAKGSTYCHLADWMQIMADVLGHKPEYLVARSTDGQLQGVLPLMRIRSRIFGHYLISMPFLSYGGPLGASEANRRLVDSAVATAKRCGVDLLELRARQALPSDLTVSHRKITVLLDLPADSETLWRERFRAKLRSQIRRPLKEGMEARFGVEQIEAFYEVFSHNMRDLGTPVLPHALFDRIAELFPDLVEVGAVYWRGQPVAAGWGFRWQDEFELTWASSLREFKRMAPNMLLYWSFIERMVQSGMRTFNFGRCTPGGGTHRFKRQWGGVDTPLPWAQWSPGSVSATPSPDQPLFKLATAAWSRMPLALANRLGPLLAQKLP